MVSKTNKYAWYSSLDPLFVVPPFGYVLTFFGFNPFGVILSN